MPESTPPLNTQTQVPYTADFPAMIRTIMWNCLGFFFLDFIIPFVSKTELNATGLQMGVLYAVISVGSLIGSPLAGWLTDHVPRRKLILGGAVGRGISYFILYAGILARSYEIIATGYASLGFSVTFFWVPLDTLIALKTDKKHRSFAYGKENSSNGKGTLLGTTLGMTVFLLGNAFIPGMSWVIYCPLILFGIANFTAGVTFLRRVDENVKYIPPEGEETTEIPTASIESTTRLPLGITSRAMFLGLILLLVALALSGVNGSLAQPFLQFYVLSDFTTNPNLVVIIYIPSGVVSMLIAPYLGRLVDRINHPYLGMIITGISGALATIALLNANNVWAFMATLILVSTASTTENLIIQNFISRISRTRRGRFFGLRSLFAQIGAIIGPILGGFVWDSLGMQWPFIISIFVVLALIPIYVVAMRKILPHLAEKVETS